MMEEKLPKGWKNAKINEITTIIGGGTPNTAIKEYYGGEIPWLSPVDLSGYKHKYISKGRKNITQLGLKKSSARLLPKDSVLFSSRAPIGYIAIAQNEVSTNQGFKSLLPSSNYDPSFAFYYLKHKTDYIESQASGTTFKEISGKKLGEIHIPLPPLSEQKRIVAKLDAIFGHLDVLREKLDRIPKLLKNFRQQVLTQAVTGELTKEWREGRELGDWENKTAKEFFEYITSGSRGWAQYYSSTGEQLFVRITNMRYGKMDLDLRSEKCQLLKLPDKQEGKRTLLRPRDILISITADVGMIALVDNKLDQEAYVNQHICLARPKADINEKFLAYYLMSEEGFGQFQIKKRGVTKAGLTLEDIRNLKIQVPSVDEQCEIVSVIESFFELADKVESQYQLLKAKVDQLPEAILSKAFRGELVEQEVKEYVMKEVEVLMAAEGMEALYKK